MGFVAAWEVEFKVLGWNLTLISASTSALTLALALILALVLALTSTLVSALASALVLTLISTFRFVYAFSAFGFFSFEIVSLSVDLPISTTFFLCNCFSFDFF